MKQQIYSVLIAFTLKQSLHREDFYHVSLSMIGTPQVREVRGWQYLRLKPGEIPPKPTLTLLTTPKYYLSCSILLLKVWIIVKIVLDWYYWSMFGLLLLPQYALLLIRGFDIYQGKMHCCFSLSVFLCCETCAVHTVHLYCKY